MNRRQALTKAIQALASVPVLGWMGTNETNLKRDCIETLPVDGWRTFKPGRLRQRGVRTAKPRPKRPYPLSPQGDYPVGWSEDYRRVWWIRSCDLTSYCTLDGKRVDPRDDRDAVVVEARKQLAIAERTLNQMRRKV